jgi:putative flippase GtrA
VASPAERARQPLRFVVVGVANTALDIGLFMGLIALGVPVIPANMVSTAAALLFSFLVNRSYTFRAGPGVAGQAARFIVVTLIALWVLQPAVIWLASTWLDPLLPRAGALLVAKLLATVVSLVWNYVLYSTFVFRRHADAGGAP